MKPRLAYLEWLDNHRQEHLSAEEAIHMFWLFRSTKWDGKRVFFIQRIAPHIFRVTHVLGMMAEFHLEPVATPVPQPSYKEEAYA